MIAAGLQALLSHWRRHPLQLFTLVAGLALATALWSGVQAINAEARASYDAAAGTLGEGRLAQLVPPEGTTIPEETWVALRRGGWLASPVVEGRLGAGPGGVRLVGLDPLTAPGGLGPVEVAEGADLTTYLSEEGAVFGRADALAALPPDLGPALVEAPEVAPGTVVADVRVAQRLLGVEGFTRLVLAPEQPARQAPLAEVAPGLALQEPGEATDPAALTDSFHLNLTAFGLLSFAVGLFIVHGAVGLAFEQRRASVRTLRAMGMPLALLVALMAAELAGLALVAGAIGAGLGYLIAAALLPDVAGTIRGLYGAEVAGTLAFRPTWALSALAIAVGGTAVAAGGAFWRLATTPLLAAGQRRAGARWAARRALRQGGAGLALLALAGAFGLWGGDALGGVVAGFACLGCLMVGGAFLLPLVLDRVLAGGARLARGPLAQWVWADARAELPGLSLALMALLLAMAANVGVSTMVSSFRQTFVAFLDQRLAAELYVDGADEATLVPLLPPEARLLPIMRVERTLAGLPGQVQALRDDATYRENWRFLDAVPDAWDRLAAGEGVLVNEQLFRRAGLALGDPLEVAPGLAPPILGVFGDYGNPVGQAILTEPLFREAFPEAAPEGFGLRVDPAQADAVAERLAAALGPASQVVDQAGVKAISLDIFERTFAVTAALNVLTLAVAGFALLMSLLTLAGIRLPQLAPVWALGTRRAVLGRLELARAVGLAALTALCALPLGLALAWVLLAVVNVEAFGWRLPMFLFPGDWARLFALALLAAGLAALWPALRLARTPPSLLLKVFSDER